MNVKTFISRSTNLIVNPKTEWECIADDHFSARSVMINFVLPYLVLDFICSMLGFILFSSNGKIYMLKFAFIQAITSFLVYILILFLSPIFIKLIGISFDIQVSRESAFKLIAYSLTPIYIVGILAGLIPVLGVMGIVGLYAFYIMWYGLDLLLIPFKKKTFFYIISVLIIIAEYILSGAVLIQIFSGNYLFRG